METIGNQTKRFHDIKAIPETHSPKSGSDILELILKTFVFHRFRKQLLINPSVVAICCQILYKTFWHALTIKFMATSFQERDLGRFSEPRAFCEIDAPNSMLGSLMRGNERLFCKLSTRCATWTQPTVFGIKYSSKTWAGYHWQLHVLYSVTGTKLPKALPELSWWYLNLWQFQSLVFLCETNVWLLSSVIVLQFLFFFVSFVHRRLVFLACLVLIFSMHVEINSF